MAEHHTPNFGLAYPDFGNPGWNTDVEDNWDALDASRALGGLSVTLAESPSSSLNVMVSAGVYFKNAGTVGTYAGTSSFAMTASSTNYIYLTDAGSLSVNTTAFPSATNLVRLATVVAGSSTITSIADARVYLVSFGAAGSAGVSSVFTRTGSVVATSGDYTVSQVTGAAPLASPALTGVPTAPTASNGTNNTQVATTAFVLANVGGGAVSSVFGRTGAIVQVSGDYGVSDVTGAAPLASPTFTGTVTIPTVSTGDNSTKAASTAYVQAQAYLTSNAVSSVFGRTGVVTATTSDYTVSQVTGAAPLASPALTGTPTAPTASNGTNTTQIATTAFVLANVGGGAVSSVFGRTGAVVKSSGDYAVADVTGAAPTASPTFTGTVTIPTPSTADNSTKAASTAYVQAQAYLTTAPVTTVFTRAGAVTAQSGDYTVSQVTGAAPLASPTLTGTPLAPTATAGTNTTQIATTAFAMNLTGVTINTHIAPITTVSDATTINFDLSVSDWQQTTIAGNRALTASNFGTGAVLNLILHQDATGSRTITSWFSGFTVLWPGGYVPVLTTTAGKRDVFSFKNIGSSTLLASTVGQGY